MGSRRQGRLAVVKRANWGSLGDSPSIGFEDNSMPGGELAVPIGQKPRWADMVDSSQETVTVTQEGAPVAEDSYRSGPAADLDNSRKGLNEQLNSAQLESAPKDFGFLLPLLEGTAPVVNESFLNPSAPVFVPLAPAQWAAQPAQAAQVISLEEALVANPAFDAAVHALVTSGKTGGRKKRIPQRSGNAPYGAEPCAPAGKRAKPGPSRCGGGEVRDRDQLNAFFDAWLQPSHKELVEEIPQLEEHTRRPPPPATEEEWQHRQEKRERQVRNVKNHADYLAFTKAREEEKEHLNQPRTPNPRDREISKRQWEYQVQQWRAHLSRWCADRGIVHDTVPLPEAADGTVKDFQVSGAE